MKSQITAPLLAAAQTYHTSGQLVLAEKHYRKILAVDPENVDALHLLGVIALQVDKPDESIRYIEHAVKKNSSEPAIFVNLGAAYRKAKRYTESRDAYKKAIALKPDLWEAHFNLGKALLDMGDFEAAIAAYQTCIAMKPDDAEAHVNLGGVYRAKGDDDAAVAEYERALQLSSEMAPAYGNIAAVLFDRGWRAAAIALVDKAISIDPRPGELRFKRSLMTLCDGQLATAWEDYESRRFSESERGTGNPTPPAYWNGEDLTGKTILLWTEQGLGDEILYSSMIADVAARAGRCILECTPRMVPVFARSFPSLKVLRYPGQGARTTPAAEIDTQISVVSLGRFFRTDFARFPRHSGYLKADPERTAALRARYEALAPGNLIVGLSWRSKNDRIGTAKSVKLSEWVDILTVPGVTFVNLQYGDCREDIEAVRQNLGVDIVQDDDVDSMKSMDDFFSQVAAMDLVITTSNTTVHAAGSLNVPAWLMLPSGVASLWYWFLRREDSPWYPSVHLFRSIDGRKNPAWWRPAVVRISEKLRALIATRAK